MNIRLGIQLKVSLLVLGLCLTLSFLIPYLLIEDTQWIVENHEITDLSDETSLRAWEIVSVVHDLRKDLQLLSDFPASALEKLRVTDPAIPAATASATICKELTSRSPKNGSYQPFRYAGRFLSAEIIADSGASSSLFVSTIDTSASTERTSLLALSPSSPAISKIERIPEKEDSSAHKAVVWGTVRLADGAHSLVIGVDVAPNLSPRHLSFIIDNETGLTLLDPVPDSPPKFADSNIFSGRSPDSDFAQGQQKIIDSATSSRLAAIENNHARGEGLSPLLRFPVQEKQPLGQSYYYLQGTPRNFKENIAEWSLEDTLEFEEGIREIAAAYVRKGKRFGGLTQAVSTVRLLSLSREDLLRDRREIEETMKSRFPEAFANVEWDWHEIVSCKRADVCTVIIPLSSSSGLHDYRFIHATFREELSAGVSRELQGVQNLAVLISFAMGVLAFVLSSFVVRPLKRITSTANQVHGTDGGELHNKIEAVRKALPIDRNDEVGGIARALEHLLLEVLNGHNQLRQAKADTDREVVERTRELQEANEQLQGLAAAKDAFLASVSHELRQPLNSIFGFIQFLEFSDLDEEQTRDLAKIRTAATYLKGLISDILDYQKIIMGGLEIELETIGTNSFLGEIRDGMAIQAADNKNTLTLECPDGIPDITNDRQRLKQILVNLLSNACKFTKEGSVTLSVEIHPSDHGRDEISFSVADSGRGMKPEEQANMFVQFKKLASKEGNRSGTGLGLVISKGLAELMGGDITFVSEYGKGTTFTVRVPLHVTTGKKAEAQEAAMSKLEPGGALSHAVAAGARKVLVIDDDPNVREMMARHLTGKGFEVFEAENGDHAVELATRTAPDVITLDAVMPHKDGWSVLEDLKSSPETRDIPVIMVTFLEEENRGFALGASDYIVKPVDWGELTQILAKYTLPGKVQHEVLLIEDDQDTREIFRRTLETGGWKVIEAKNGKEGISVLENETPACILLDLMMPVMDGFSFVEEYNRHPEWHAIPIIVVSAKTFTSEDRKRLNGSVEKVLQKGGGPEDLLDQIITHVNKLSLPTQNNDKK